MEEPQLAVCILGGQWKSEPMQSEETYILLQQVGPQRKSKNHVNTDGLYGFALKTNQDKWMVLMEYVAGSTFQAT